MLTFITVRYEHTLSALARFGGCWVCVHWQNYYRRLQKIGWGYVVVAVVPSLTWTNICESVKPALISYTTDGCSFLSSTVLLEFARC